MIVESSAKCKTISKYLNSSNNQNKWTVVASLGHIRDLDKKNGIIIDDDKNDFIPNYVITSEKRKVVTNLKSAVNEADMVYIASDPDREGESIAWHIKQVLKLKKGQYKRITFTEITKNAIENAISNPRDIDENLAQAQETRRLLDRLVGFNLSPALWNHFKTNTSTILSAGRIQSAVLNLIIQRQEEVDNFKTTPSYSICGVFKDKNAKLHSPSKYNSIDDVKTFLKSLSNVFSIHSVKKHQTKKSPDLPYITSSLQQDASKISMSIKTCMRVAQDLYEKGLITYMRTDSYNISDDFKKKGMDLIRSKYGEQYLGSVSNNKKKNSQEAHECIHITDPYNTNIESIYADSKNHVNLYKMIWDRSIAYLMSPAIYDELDVKIIDNNMNGNTDYFIYTDKEVAFNGYLLIYGVAIGSSITNIPIAGSTIKCTEIIGKHSWSSPPNLYTDSTIIKMLEKEGLGRPSTYSTILTKLYDREYISQLKAPLEKKEGIDVMYKPSKQTTKLITTMVPINQNNSALRIHPSKTGISVNDFLKHEFSYIVDKTFTMHMEADLDKIADGESEKNKVIGTFWNRFKLDLKNVSSESQHQQRIEPEQVIMMVSGIQYIIRNAKYGKVVEYTEGDSRKFIPIDGYLKSIKRSLNENDITFLRSLPKNIPEQPEHVLLSIGKFGLYLKNTITKKNTPYHT